MFNDFFLRLIEISLPVSLCIVVIMILSPLLEKRYSARLRYWIWVVILLRLLIPIDLSYDNTSVQIDAGEYIEELNIVSSQLFTNEANTYQDSINDQVVNNTAKKSISPISVMTNIWLVVSIMFMLSNIYIYIRFLLRIKKRSLIANSNINQMLEKVKTELGIKGTISIRVMDSHGPMIVGIIRPTILIPNQNYTNVDLYLILKHELIHHKRHDLCIKVLMLLCKSVYWFNPFVYIMISRFNQVIEMSCDELVIKDDRDIRRRYIETILNGVDKSSRRESLLTTNYNGGLANMKKRFKNIAYSDKKSTSAIALIIAITMLSGMSIFAGCDLVTKNNDTQTAIVDSEDKSVETDKNMDKSKIIGVPSEGKNEEIEKAVNDYFNFTDEEKEATRYYYNIVDLNGDGKENAIVLLVGMYTSGTGGSTALIMDKDNDDYWNVRQKLTLINPPIIISQELNDGWHNLIVYRSGGGAKGSYVVLKAVEGIYPSVNDGQEIENLDGVSGVAIINNDLAKDLEDGTANYLK